MSQQNTITHEELNPDRVVDDPHHCGSNQWAYKNGILYHRHRGANRWTVVKRVSFTKQRFERLFALLEDV